MGRTGTAGAGVTRKKVLPEGVTELREHYSFEGIRVSKDLLEFTGGKIRTTNPFDIEFPREEHSTSVGTWAYDPAMRELIVAPTRMFHEDAIEAANREDDYDRFVKGEYTKPANLLGLYTDRHIPRNPRDEWGAWNMQFDTIQMLKKFFPANTRAQVGTFAMVTGPEISRSIRPLGEI